MKTDRRSSPWKATGEYERVGRWSVDGYCYKCCPHNLNILQVYYYWYVLTSPLGVFLHRNKVFVFKGVINLSPSPNNPNTNNHGHFVSIFFQPVIFIASFRLLFFICVLFFFLEIWNCLETNETIKVLLHGGDIVFCFPVLLKCDCCYWWWEK